MPDTRRLPDVGLLLAVLSESSNQLMNVDPLVQQTAGYGVQHLCVCVVCVWCVCGCVCVGVWWVCGVCVWVCGVCV